MKKRLTWFFLLSRPIISSWDEMNSDDKRLLEASASGQTDKVLQLIEENGHDLHKYKDQVRRLLQLYWLLWKDVRAQGHDPGTRRSIGPIFLLFIDVCPKISSSFDVLVKNPHENNWVVSLLERLKWTGSIKVLRVVWNVLWFQRFRSTLAL